jgi:hypothetical protein
MVFENFTFVNKIFIYDGKEHSILIKGPTVSEYFFKYIGNNKREIGDYIVKCLIYKNNKIIKYLTAKMSIYDEYHMKLNYYRMQTRLQLTNNETDFFCSSTYENNKCYLTPNKSPIIIPMLIGYKAISKVEINLNKLQDEKIDVLFINKNIKTITFDGPNKYLNRENIIIDPDNKYLCMDEYGIYSRDKTKMFCIFENNEIRINDHVKVLYVNPINLNLGTTIKIGKIPKSLEAITQNKKRNSKFTLCLDSTEFSNSNIKYIDKKVNIIFNNSDVTIPNSLKNLDFLKQNYTNKGYVNISNIKIRQNNNKYKVFDDAIYTKDMKTLFYYFGRNKNVYNVPDSVQYIAQYAFFNSNLEVVFLPNNLKSSYYNSFNYCDNLVSVLPKSIKNNNLKDYKKKCIFPNKVTLCDEARLGLYSPTGKIFLSKYLKHKWGWYQDFEIYCGHSIDNNRYIQVNNYIYTKDKNEVVGVVDKIKTPLKIFKQTKIILKNVFKYVTTYEVEEGNECFSSFKGVLFQNIDVNSKEKNIIFGFNPQMHDFEVPKEFAFNCAYCSTKNRTLKKFIFSESCENIDMRSLHKFLSCVYYLPKTLKTLCVNLPENNNFNPFKKLVYPGTKKEFIKNVSTEITVGINGKPATNENNLEKTFYKKIIFVDDIKNTENMH